MGSARAGQVRARCTDRGLGSRQKLGEAGLRPTKVPLGFTHTQAGPQHTCIHTAHTCTHTQLHKKKSKRGQGKAGGLRPATEKPLTAWPAPPGETQLTKTPCLWPTPPVPTAQPHGTHSAEGRKWRQTSLPPSLLLSAHTAAMRWAVFVGQTGKLRPGDQRVLRTQHPAMVGQRWASMTALETVPAHCIMPRWVGTSQPVQEVTGSPHPPQPLGDTPREHLPCGPATHKGRMVTAVTQQTIPSLSAAEGSAARHGCQRCWEQKGGPSPSRMGTCCSCSQPLRLRFPPECPTDTACAGVMIRGSEDRRCRAGPRRGLHPLGRL